MPASGGTNRFGGAPGGGGRINLGKMGETENNLILGGEKDSKSIAHGKTLTSAQKGMT